MNALEISSVRFSFVSRSAGESDENEDDLESKENVKKEGNSCVKQEKDAANACNNSAEKKDGQCQAKVEKDGKDAQRAKELKVNESEMVRDLKTQLK